MAKSVIGGFQKIVKNRSRDYLEDQLVQNKKKNLRERRNNKGSKSSRSYETPSNGNDYYDDEY